MQCFDEVNRELERSGKADAAAKLAQSDDGKKLKAMLDASEFEKAAGSGDAQAMKNILSRVLRTEEGRRLAENVKKMMQDK